jgi:hypothetical protein
MVVAIKDLSALRFSLAFGWRLERDEKQWRRVFRRHP